MKTPSKDHNSLNRTFYGIETVIVLVFIVFLKLVLIVPFMELKHEKEFDESIAGGCLNRTFYGIETT